MARATVTHPVQPVLIATAKFPGSMSVARSAEYRSICNATASVWQCRHEPSAYASFSGVTTRPGIVFNWIAARRRKRLSVQLWTTTSLVPLPVLNSSRSPTPSSSWPRRSERCTRSAVGASVAHGTPLEKTVGVTVGVGAGIGVSVTTGSAGGTGVGVSVTPGFAAGAAVGVSVVTAGAAGGTGVGVSVGLGTVWALPLVVAH